MERGNKEAIKIRDGLSQTPVSSLIEGLCVPVERCIMQVLLSPFAEPVSLSLSGGGTSSSVSSSQVVSLVGLAPR